jgi:hypothetical protein
MVVFVILAALAVGPVVATWSNLGWRSLLCFGPLSIPVLVYTPAWLNWQHVMAECQWTDTRSACEYMHGSRPLTADQLFWVVVVTLGLLLIGSFVFGITLLIQGYMEENKEAEVKAPQNQVLEEKEEQEP